MKLHPLRTIAVVSALAALAACTNYGEVLEPSALQPLTNEQEQRSAISPPPSIEGQRAGLFSSPSSATQQPANQQPATQLAAITTNARVQFAPAVGVSAQAVPALSARLRARAAQRGVGIATSVDPAKTHIMKGYFSAFTENRETTVIYVWDVLDPAGNRLHRIQGQQKQSGSGGEGWAAVTAPTVEAIADRTIDDLAVWLSTSAG